MRGIFFFLLLVVGIHASAESLCASTPLCRMAYQWDDRFPIAFPNVTLRYQNLTQEDATLLLSLLEMRVFSPHGLRCPHPYEDPVLVNDTISCVCQPHRNCTVSAHLLGQSVSGQDAGETIALVFFILTLSLVLALFIKLFIDAWRTPVARYGISLHD